MTDQTEALRETVERVYEFLVIPLDEAPTPSAGMTEDEWIDRRERARYEIDRVLGRVSRRVQEARNAKLAEMAEIWGWA